MRRRRAIIVFIVGVVLLVLLGGAMPRLIKESLSGIPESSSLNVVMQEGEHSDASTPAPQPSSSELQKTARQTLEQLEVKGRAPKTGYTRTQFGDGWAKIQGCSVRDIILYRDLENPVLDGECKVASGLLSDPYTGQQIVFTKDKGSVVQIDHIVALSDAWQKGAQQLTKQQRVQLANDPLELLAVDGPANQQKGDGDAATWLPKNKSFRCEYVARQIAVKKKYALWITVAEKEAMKAVLEGC